MTMPTRNDHDLNWLVSSFINRIPGARSAVVVSRDALVLALSENIARETADQLAAVTAGMASLTAGAARCFEAGVVNQVIIEMTGGYLFLSQVSDGSALAIMCDPDCDIGLIGYEMSLLVVRIGQVLTPALRTGPPALPPR